MKLLSSADANDAVHTFAEKVKQSLLALRSLGPQLNLYRRHGLVHRDHAVHHRHEPVHDRRDEAGADEGSSLYIGWSRLTEPDRLLG